MLSVSCRKAYVSVNVDIDEEGSLHPRFIRWEGGRYFRLTRCCINAVLLQRRSAVVAFVIPS